VVTFKGRVDKMEVKDIEETLEVTESVVEQQELCTEIANMDNFGSLENQPLHQRLAVLSRH
jgi:hypothetical protein